jgi:predicted NAD/FAD-binding protein
MEIEESEMSATTDGKEMNKKKIAIVGSGIAGLTCAYLLKQKYDVTVFEKNDYLGGHTATVDVEVAGKQYAIDTGFIVFNDRTYPNFEALLEQIGIGRKETEMSFSVRNLNTGMEYNGHDLNTLFAQRRNILNLSFWKLINEILKFNKLGKALYISGQIAQELTLGDFLAEHQFSDYFCEHYILPMGAAIWSTSLIQMKGFPLHFFIRFFYHHGLLNVTNRPQWYVVPNGSRSYIPKLIEGIEDKCQLSTDILQINRKLEGVEIQFEDGEVEAFDEVILACHSDQALSLLADPTDEENKVLGAIPYSENEVVLHTDTNLLPERELAWASWNFQLDNDRSRPAAVTYNMNILMGLESDTTFCVTLNQSKSIDDNKVLRKFIYHHPVFNQESVQAQGLRHEICGVKHTHFAGAYWYNGFHEDGVRSALDVCRRLGVEL